MKFLEEDLPFRGKIRSYNDGSHNDGYFIKRERNNYEKEKIKMDPWVFRKRILHQFLGQHVNLAFSYYCEHAPKMRRELFWSELDRSKGPTFGRYSSRYYLDGNGIICFNPRVKQKKPIRVVEPGGEWIRVCKKSGIPEKKLTWKQRWFGKLEIVEIYTGIIHEFETKKCVEYRRAQKQLEKALRKAERERKEAELKISYNFLSKSEQKVQEEKVIDKQKLYAHGFDDESFKTIR